jgi:hypothetical protein
LIVLLLSAVIRHGAWSMGHGAWSMGHGAWGMEHGFIWEDSVYVTADTGTRRNGDKATTKDIVIQILPIFHNSKK